MGIKILPLIPILLFVPLSSCRGPQTHFSVEDYKAGEISVNNDGTFKILQLCDIHLGNKDNQQLQLDFLNLTISDAKTKGANLIVLDGDSFTFADKVTAKRLFDFIDSYEIPWTFTFGNHDEQCYFSVTWLTSFLNNYGKNCVFKDNQGDDVYGNSNFYIDVINQDDSLFERIFIFDSNRYYFSDYFGYDYIKQDQIDWYERVVNSKKNVKSVAFFHIPVPEFEVALNLYNEHDPSVTYLGGKAKEGISNPKYNSELFDKMVELNSTNAIFCAHDHSNDIALKYKGIVLSYGVDSTDRIYYENDMLGGQLITIDSTHEFTSDSFERIYHTYKEIEG